MTGPIRLFFLNDAEGLCTSATLNFSDGQASVGAIEADILENKLRGTGPFTFAKVLIPPHWSPREHKFYDFQLESQADRSYLVHAYQYAVSKVES